MNLISSTTSFSSSTTITFGMLDPSLRFVEKKYITFVNRDENIDFDDKMQNLKSEFSELLKSEQQSKAELLNVFKELGYEIKL